MLVPRPRISYTTLTEIKCFSSGDILRTVTFSPLSWVPPPGLCWGAHTRAGLGSQSGLMIFTHPSQESVCSQVFGYLQKGTCSSNQEPCSVHGRVTWDQTRSLLHTGQVLLAPVEGSALENRKVWCVGIKDEIFSLGGGGSPFFPVQKYPGNISQELRVVPFKITGTYRFLHPW